MPFRCNCNPLRMASLLSTHTHKHRLQRSADRTCAFLGGARTSPAVCAGRMQEEGDEEEGRRRRRGGGHLQTHLADNQIRVSARYITDKLFIKQKARVAAGGPRAARRRRPPELKGRGEKGSGGKAHAAFKGPSLHSQNRETGTSVGVSFEKKNPFIAQRSTWGGARAG